MKSPRFRRLARQDVEAAVDHYIAEAGDAVALRFIEALKSAYRAIVRHPLAGSARHGSQVGLAGVRSQRVARFPYLVFYTEQAGDIEIWRVLHAQRDIPDLLRDDAD